MGFDFVHNSHFAGNEPPLDVDEVISVIKKRWRVTYDLRLVVRGKRVYLQMMWRYLEQLSFPLDEDGYRIHLREVLEVVNRLGQARVVRHWLATTPAKPRIGQAMSLPLRADPKVLGEFNLSIDL